MDDYTKGQALINSIIGDGTRFRGDLDLKGLLRIDGDFEGNIRTEGRVLVGKGGRARCLIVADTVVVGG
ncbi:MAG: polymer-forming cytoskeletal protein, partial [Spirochaetaceae bacterium]|nr:polymer-forming cytoskeletal protein [Spirochaetaceae bacterium]